MPHPAWENSQHSAMPSLVWPSIDVWETCARNYVLMTHHYPDLRSASNGPFRKGNLLQPNKSITQIWVVTHHQCRICALVSQTSLCHKTRGGFSGCHLYQQLKKKFVYYPKSSIKPPPSQITPLPLVSPPPLFRGRKLMSPPSLLSPHPLP